MGRAAVVEEDEAAFEPFECRAALLAPEGRDALRFAGPAGRPAFPVPAAVAAISASAAAAAGRACGAAGANALLASAFFACPGGTCPPPAAPCALRPGSGAATGAASARTAAASAGASAARVQLPASENLWVPSVGWSDLTTS